LCSDIGPLLLRSSSVGVSGVPNPPTPCLEQASQGWSNFIDYRFKYAAAYNFKAKEYNFYYELEGQEGSWKVAVLNSADDCVALCDLFRNESPIYYWLQKDSFLTGRHAWEEQELGNAVAEVPPD
jgi:hypothetical protein